MTEVLLSSGDVCEITGLAPYILDDWCRKGIVRSLEGGQGQGSHRRFSFMQTLGIAVATKVQRTERSCVLSYVGMVVEAFGAMSKEKLLKKMKNVTHLMLVAATDGGPCLVLDGPAKDRIDVQQTYDEVVNKIEEIEQRLKAQTGGRIRGLAGAAKREAMSSKMAQRKGEHRIELKTKRWHRPPFHQGVSNQGVIDACGITRHQRNQALPKQPSPQRPRGGGGGRLDSGLRLPAAAGRG